MKNRKFVVTGSTLVEMLVIVAIIGLLAALSLPGVAKQRAEAQRHREETCKSYFSVSIPTDKYEFSAVRPIIMKALTKKIGDTIALKKRLMSARKETDGLPYENQQDINKRVSAFKQLEQTEIEFVKAKESINEMASFSKSIGLSDDDLGTCGWSPWHFLE